MKNFKKFLLPAFMVLAGAGSAFATHVNKENTKAVRPGFAYHFGENPECIDAQKECDTQGTVVCTGDVGMGTETLYELSGTGCPNSLWEIQ
ncbi:DUF6520 family protein [Chryseobacterium sp.]|uniref:DUF6520 family protein n=1 Tax=Chryseobacterium sp. TaxID=1871047 RepID=UPI0011C8740F|nr:DUF6520 family protein [Chryseobacterium sp.]TXF78849.1 hypothetical protein FUA25_00175 [Chryseobacterium sp.]